MVDNGITSKQSASINLSRNSPIALVVGVGGFLGSHLADSLLRRGIQVVGLDNLSVGDKRNLDEAVKSRSFHFINRSIVQKVELELPRLDYSFFTPDLPESAMFLGEREKLFSLGLHNFLELIRRNSSKAVLVSSIELYDRKISSFLLPLKRAEINFARYVKDNKLNARIVRLAPLYGPRMHFRSEDPISRLIQAALLGELQKEQTSLDFSSRAIFVEDAVDLLLKSIFHVGTAHKIYDGVATKPVKVADIKQILLDPIWYEQRGFEPTEIPPWPTPNLNKSLRELSWRSKDGWVHNLRKTVSYFKDRSIHIPGLPIEELEQEAKDWVREEPKVEVEEEARQSSTPNRTKIAEVKKKAPALLGVILIFYVLVLLPVSVILGAFNVKANLDEASSDIQQGNFSQAEEKVKSAQATVDNLAGVVSAFNILKSTPLKGRIDQLEELLGLGKEGIDGVDHAILGSQALFDTTKSVSGEESKDLASLSSEAQSELSSANTELSGVSSKLSNNQLTDGLPSLIRDRTIDFANKLNDYSLLVEKGRVAAIFLPQLVAEGGKKSYLLLLTNSLQQRGSGGVVVGVGRLDFDNGKLLNLKVEPASSWDGKLTELIQPPTELVSDMGQKSFSLRDVTYEPDFPTVAKMAEFIYAKEGGGAVNGVIELDLSAMKMIIKAVGGISLPTYSEQIDSDNVVQKVFDHKGDVNYMPVLGGQLLNKVFFPSTQTWPSVLGALNQSLAQKHVLLYFDDPTAFSMVLSEDWSGAVARPADVAAGLTNDFQAVIDENVGNNMVNYYTQRSFSLVTSITDRGLITHQLTIDYKNISQSDTYKDRLRVYLPLGSKLNKLTFDNADLTSQVSSYSDYGRTVYSILISIPLGKEKPVIVDYDSAQTINFSNNLSRYRLSLFKQSPTSADHYSWSLKYTGLKLTQVNGIPVTTAKDALQRSIDLSSDQVLEVELSK